MHRKKISEKRCIRQNLTKRKLVQLLFPQVYLFLAVLGPQSGAWAFSGCRAQALGPVDSVIVVCRLSSCAACVGSRARRLSCSVACGILVPQPGIKPSPSALEGGFLTTGPPGKSPSAIIWKSENIDLKAKFFLVIGRTTSIKKFNSPKRYNLKSCVP